MRWKPMFEGTGSEPISIYQAGCCLSGDRLPDCADQAQIVTEPVQVKEGIMRKLEVTDDMKTWKVILLLAGCLALTGCSKDQAKKTTKNLVRSVVENVNEYQQHKDVEVHTEEEMREFALQCLEERYGKKFQIDEAYCVYGHLNGHEELPMTLRARVYAEEDAGKIGGIFVEEPNIFQDNYSVMLYLDAVEAVIRPEMEKYGLEGAIQISYPLVVGTIGDDLSAEDILYDDSTCICFYAAVEREDDPDAYLPLIRKWLDFLYTCDYMWYFALAYEGDLDRQVIGISKGDYLHTSQEEWTDEEILWPLECPWEE